MNKTINTLCFAGVAAVLILSSAAQAQTLATGDSRTVVQPAPPPACQTLNAQFTSSMRASPPATSADDTARVQAALNACANTGNAVVLTASGSNNAFFTGSLNVVGEGLIIQSGVTLYGNTSYVSNPQMILVTGTNSSIFGPGTIDGRGDIYSGGMTPRLVQATNTTNFNISNVTLKQALHPNLYVEGGSGFTAWGITVLTPADRANADGIDIDSLTNASVINSTINAGDDGVAIKTNSGNISNVTVSGNRLYGTHGLSVGSITTAYTVSNILFSNNYVYALDQLGTPVSSTVNAQGIVIKTDPCQLTVKDVSYVNTCMTGIKHLIYMTTEYAACSPNAAKNIVVGTPQVSNIVVNGVYATQSTLTSTSPYSRFLGESAAPLQVYLANVSVDTTRQNGDANATVYEYNSNDIPSGTGVTTPSFTPTFSGSVPSCTF